MRWVHMLRAVTKDPQVPNDLKAGVLIMMYSNSEWSALNPKLVEVDIRKAWDNKHIQGILNSAHLSLDGG